MDDALEARVSALRKAGRYAEAATLREGAGDLRGASQLYADVWEWEKAIALAEDAGALAMAYGHALAADDREALGRLLAMLPDHPEEAQLAAELADAKGRVIDAARLREAAGEVLEAAEAFTRAGELFEAARCYESAGEYRRAGMLYERRLKEDGTDGAAALRLGRILAHFGRWDHAARALQRAEEDPERRDAALALQVACFTALQMHDAAGACLARLRREHGELPASVPAFLEATFGDEAGLAGLARGDEATQLLAGRYRVLHSLGAGGTGRVLLAHDGFYERKVAVKVLNVGTGSQGRDAYLRFAKEARVAAGLEHPNVVRVFEFNPDGPFLVMEHLAGGTLEDRLQAAAERDQEEGSGEGRTARLPYAVIRHVGASILRGLEAVHRRGVVHRDLKPANVFFSAGGDVKLGDFGVAHLQDLGATLTGALMGTLAYMAPEQITGSTKPTAATDLYAFGVILFRLVAGELPYRGPDFVAQHLESPVPVPSERGADRRFDALVQRLLAKEQQARPESAETVRAAFEALDWRDPEADAFATLAEMERRPGTVSLPALAPEARAEVKDADRYTVIEEREGGGVLALDGALGRNVRIVPCDEALASWFKAWATADHPFLQAVLDVDAEHGRAILEEPLGERLGQLALEPARRAQVRAQLHEALGHLHGAGLVHGHVSPGRVRISRGRAVLMLPPRPGSGAQATPAADLAALDALVPRPTQREAPPR